MKGKFLLFSTARPLFFSISAMVTTVDMAANKLDKALLGAKFIQKQNSRSTTEKK